MQWKDETSYSRGQKDKTPQIWTIRFGEWRVTVHRHIDYSDDVWLLSTVPNVFERHELKSKDIEQAKIEALERLQFTLQKTANKIEGFNDEQD